MNSSKSLAPKSSEKNDPPPKTTDQNEPETGGGERKCMIWKFTYFAEQIDTCASSVKGAKDHKPLLEFCRYILCDHENKTLVACFLQAKPRSWFHQFYYLNRKTIEELPEANKHSIEQVLKELGPNYQILYERDYSNNKESHTRNLQTPFALSTPQLTEDLKRDFALETPEGPSLVQEAGKGSQGKTMPKEVEKQKEKEMPGLETPENESAGWLDRIKGGELLRDIGQEIAKKNDKKLAFLYLKSFERLKAEEVKLGKRAQKKAPEEEKKVEKYLKTEKGGMQAPPRKERRRLSKEEHEKEESIEINVFEGKQKAQSKSELLANCCAYYKHQKFFDEKIRPLPLFKKELEAFEKTISPEQKKEVQKAMDNGFNPVYYILKWKTKEKGLDDIRIARDKKGFRNSHVLGIVYDYIVNHLQIREKSPE